MNGAHENGKAMQLQSGPEMEARDKAFEAVKTGGPVSLCEVDGPRYLLISYSAEPGQDGRPKDARIPVWMVSVPSSKVRAPADCLVSP